MPLSRPSPAVRSGVVASDFTSDALTVALRDLLSSQQRWEEMSRSGREFAAEQGSWNESEARLFDLYEQILRGPGVAR